MDLRYLLSGGAPVIKRIQVAQTVIVGVPVTAAVATGIGVVIAAADTAVDMVGVTVDAVDTLGSAQNADGSETESLAGIIINPDAVYGAKISGGATADTALVQHTITAATSDGLDVTDGFDVDTPLLDGGVCWFYQGVANQGKARKIVTGNTTSKPVDPAFPGDHQVGDIDLDCNLWFAINSAVELTSDFAQLRGESAVDTDNANFHVVDLILNDISNDGINNSFGLILPYDSIYAGSQLA